MSCVCKITLLIVRGKTLFDDFYVLKEISLRLLGGLAHKKADDTQLWYTLLIVILWIAEAICCNQNQCNHYKYLIVNFYHILSDHRVSAGFFWLLPIKFNKKGDCEWSIWRLLVVIKGNILWFMSTGT